MHNITILEDQEKIKANKEKYKNDFEKEVRKLKKITMEKNVRTSKEGSSKKSKEVNTVKKKRVNIEKVEEKEKKMARLSFLKS